MPNHHRGSAPVSRLRRATWGSLAILVALLCAGPILITRAQQSAPYVAFLPVIQAPGQAATPQPPTSTGGGVFPRQDLKTDSAGLAVDGAGGMHGVYVVYAPLEQQPPAFYTYCAPTADCVNPASWQHVALGAPAEEAQIALTPAGQPRVLFRATPTDGSFMHPYYYAACDSRCTDASQWTTVKVAETSMASAEDFYMPQRSFALDHLGRPRFVYVTGDLGDPRKGTFYTYCDADCATNDPADPHWHETQISYSDGYSYEIFSYPALAFTPQNQPRVVAMIYGQRDGVHYLACDAACDDASNWGRAYLLDRGFGPMASWDLEVNSAGQPRVVVYQEGFDDGSGDQLIYGWCDGACLDGNSWAGSGAGLPQNEGEDPDLELDAQGSPRIAYHAAGAAGLGYLWCDTACQSADGQWQSAILEPSADLDAAFPVPVPSGCDRAAWSGGFRPVLALDAQGNPRVGSDAERMMSCFYQDPLDPNNNGTRVETYKHVRFVFVPQP